MLKYCSSVFTLLIFIFLLSSCQPVHRFTRLKKTPREYTFNYCQDDIKAPKSEFDKQIWVVFSDRDENASYLNPGGKVKFKEFGFMDAFLVLKRKGEYLQLMKYDPAVINGINSRKIKDRKNAEYCGWIHESKLLLTRQSVTDITSGFKQKQLTIITNSAPLSEPDRFFTEDSIKVFKEDNLIKENGSVPYYSIVYTLKESEDKKKSLIGKKDIISPDSAQTKVLGWLPTSLVRDVGKRLHVDLSSLPDSTLLFKNRLRTDTLALSEWDFVENNIFNKSTPTMKYNPVSSYKQLDKDTVSLRTAITTPIIDSKDNYVFNVNGNKIYYGDFKEYEREFHKLNIVFVLEGHQRVIESYAEIANVVQNLQPLLEENKDAYSYKFGAIFTSSNSSESYPTVKSTGLLTDYTQLMDSMTVEVDSKKPKYPIPANNAWSGVRKAVEILEPYKEETNILVIIGGTGSSEWADSTLVRRMADINCRILGFQMHGVKDVPGNNFVLQIENMINVSAKRIAHHKKEKIVYSNQIKPNNRYRESSKNVYKLDFPNRSMTQGWILFPEKEAELPLDILTNSIDSLIAEVKWDNEKMLSNLNSAFNAVGKQRNSYDKLFAEYDDIENPKSLNKSFATKFVKENPRVYIPSQRVNLTDSLNKEAKYHLLLSQDEFDDLTLFIERLSRTEVDIKYKGVRKNKKKDICNYCEEDEDDLLDKGIVETTSDTISTQEIRYRSTSKLRKDLYNLYMNEMKDCKLCKRTTKIMKKYTLAEAQEQITGAPTYTDMLSEYTVGDIRSKKRLPDAELDVLIEYFKSKKEQLVERRPFLDKFESNGVTYYWIDQKLLP